MSEKQEEHGVPFYPDHFTLHTPIRWTRRFT